MVKFDVKKNKDRENYVSTILHYYVPYEDRGGAFLLEMIFLIK